MAVVELTQPSDPLEFAYDSVHSHGVCVCVGGVREKIAMVTSGICILCVLRKAGVSFTNARLSSSDLRIFESLKSSPVAYESCPQSTG